MQQAHATNLWVPHIIENASACSAVWRKNNMCKSGICKQSRSTVSSRISCSERVTATHWLTYMWQLYVQWTEGNSYLSMKVPKSSLMVFCMFSVHSQLHWSLISRHKMFKATSATAVSAAHSNKHSEVTATQRWDTSKHIRHAIQKKHINVGKWQLEIVCMSKLTVEFCCTQVVKLHYCMVILQHCQEWDT